MNQELTQADSQIELTVQPDSLEGKTCVVTGASRGIGRAIALRLAGAGANVVLNYCTSSDAAAAVADEIDESHGDALLAQADVANAGAVEEMAATVRDQYGPIDVLVNNAGVTADKRFDDMTWEDWSHVVDTNLGGTFNCTKAFYEDIKDAEEGRLVNISSIIGQRGNYGQANYAASKSALFGFTKSLAFELAPHGSTANCVAPGYTSTEMVENVREDIQDRIKEQIPLARFATVDEIASAVRYLASDEASYITGEILDVNGGMYV